MSPTSRTADPSGLASPRVLIIRLSALGDVVMASGLIPALREVHPDARLVWLVEPAAAPLLRHNPRLDSVMVLPRGEWRQLWQQRRFVALWRSVRQFRGLLRAERFDIAIDAQGLLKSALCAWWSSAARRVSLIGREGSQRLMTERVLPPPDPTDRRPIASEYRALSVHLGARAEYRMDLVVGAEPAARAAAALAGAGVREGARLVALCPFTTRPQKHWFDDRWSALAIALSAQGYTTVLLGGPADAASAAAIAASAPGTIDLAGQLALDDTVAVIARSSLLVGVDTGLTHMGTALGVPSVALFGSTRPYLDAGTPRTVVLYEALACSPCRRHPTCGGRFDCMRAIEVDAVLRATKKALAAP
jgi:heptosyltransferase-1